MQVGDKVYLKAAGNNARYDKEVRIEEYIIRKIGRKYFEVSSKEHETWTIKFNLENNKQVTNYSADWILYFSKQEIIDEIETDNLTREIRNRFDSWSKVNLTLDQLRRIVEIIREQ